MSVIKNKDQLPIFLSVKDLMELLRISESTAYKYISKNEIPFIRIGHKIRIPRDRLFQIIEGEKSH